MYLQLFVQNILSMLVLNFFLNLSTDFLLQLRQLQFLLEQCEGEQKTFGNLKQKQINYPIVQSACSMCRVIHLAPLRWLAILLGRLPTTRLPNRTGTLDCPPPSGSGAASAANCPDITDSL